jgi:hypothetical protein
MRPNAAKNPRTTTMESALARPIRIARDLFEQRATIDARAPAQGLARVDEARADAAAEIAAVVSTDVDAFSRALQGFVDPTRQKALLRSLERTNRRALREHQRVRRIVALAEAAFAEDPRAAWTAFMNIDDDVDPVATRIARAAVLRGRKMRGEARGWAALDGISRTAEPLYATYVRLLWRLSKIRDGKPPNDGADKFGALLAQAFEKLGHTASALLDRDADILRNANAHLSGVRVSARASFTVVSSSDPGRRVTLTATQLLRRAEDLFSAAALHLKLARMAFVHRLMVRHAAFPVVFDHLPGLATDEMLGNGGRQLARCLVLLPIDALPRRRRRRARR